MTPTRKQFKDFIAAIQQAMQKEEAVNKAFELIWDEDQGQHAPFYVSPFWEPIYQAFSIMFGQQYDKYSLNDLYWWIEEAPKGEAKYWVGEKEHNVSDIDDFYDYLIHLSNETNNQEASK